MYNYQGPVRVLFSAGNVISPDCDCACTPALLPDFSGAEVDSVLYHTTSAWPIARQAEWRIYHNPLGPAAVVALTAAAQALWQSFSAPASLHFASADPQTQTALVALLQSGMVRPATSVAPWLPPSQVLGAWVHVAARCNLACDYCYLPKRSSDPTPDTLRRVVDAVLRSATKHGHTTVHLKYSGGEPLLRFPVLMETHRYAQAQAARLGKTLEGVVLSNGTLLTPPIVAQLRTAGLRLMLSLDGLGAAHDDQRHYPNGRGSFADVLQAIDMAQSGGIEPVLSITVTARSASSLPELISWILERDLPFSLNLYRENDYASPKLIGDEEDLIAGFLAAYRVIEHHLPRRSLLGALADRANFVAPHCRACSVGENYLVFDAQGRVAKCQMDMAHSVTDMNDPDPLGTVRRSATGLQNPSVEDKEDCQDCPWRYWCSGGCPLIAYRAKGSYTIKSPYCAIYKAILPEMVRLEGLRLIKYADIVST